MDELNRFITIEWLLRTPQKFNFLKHNYESGLHDAAVVVWVYDDETPEEDREFMISELGKSNENLFELKNNIKDIGNVIYTYSHFDKLEEEHRDRLEDVERPFLMLFDPQGEGDTFFHMYPGNNCFNQMEDYEYQKVENHT